MDNLLDQDQLWNNMKRMLCRTIAEKGRREHKWDIMQSDMTFTTGPYLLLQLFVGFVAHHRERIRETTMLARSIASASEIRTRVWSVFFAATLSGIVKNEHIRQLFTILLRDRAPSVRSACVHVLGSVDIEIQSLFSKTMRKMCLTDPAMFVVFHQKEKSLKHKYDFISFYLTVKLDVKQSALFAELMQLTVTPCK